MKKLVYLFNILIAGSCSPSEEVEQQNKARSMSTNNIPTFHSAEAEDLYNKGNDAREAGDFTKARMYFEKSHQVEPGHMLNLNNLASTCLVLEDFGSAQKYYVKALEYDPGYEITYVNYSNFFIATNQYEMGIKFVEENRNRLKDQEMQTYLSINLALMYANVQQCDKAKKEMDDAKKLMNGNSAVISTDEEIKIKCP